MTGASFAGHAYADLYDHEGNVVHLLPNVLPVLVVQATLGVAGAILAEASRAIAGRREVIARVLARIAETAVDRRWVVGRQQQVAQHAIGVAVADMDSAGIDPAPFRTVGEFILTRDR